MSRLFNRFPKEIHRLGPTPSSRKQRRKSTFAQFPQDSVVSSSLSLRSKDSKDSVRSPVQNVENTRTAMAHKAAASEGQICAECGNAKWVHYHQLKHSFVKPRAA